MPSRAIDFRTIRPHQGSQHGGFEELVCQLAALDTGVGLPFHRKGAGADAGLECYRLERDGSETGWQAKYLFDFGSEEAGQITVSFDQAVEKHPALTRFIVCLPFDLSDGRREARKSQRDRWNDWVYARETAIAPRVVTIELWGGFQLTERLSRHDPLYVGRCTYWFERLHFSQEWFRERFEITRAALGRRYTPELNVELPIRQALLGFARNPAFIQQILGWADELDEVGHHTLREIGTSLQATRPGDVAALKERVTAIPRAIRSAPRGPTDPLPLAQWRWLLSDANALLERCSTAIWELRSPHGSDTDDLRRAHHFANRLRDALDRVAVSLGAPGVGLANANRLLLNGEAGVGKSHLLADITSHHIARGFPAVLTLGGAFSDADPWRQMGEQLGLTHTPPDALLGALDAAAEAAGTRALVMVDALNERNGIAVWSERLRAFLATADRFPHVAVLVSCRTTFVPFIVREIDEATLPRLEHRGFAGRAAEAARRYLDHRCIVRMATPHFSPEFENPLFLRTCCDMLERRGEREIPRGLAGVSSIFEFYFNAVAESLNRRMGLDPRLRRIDTALADLTAAMVKDGIGYLPLDTVIAILERVQPSNGCLETSLLFQLENEGVLAVEPVQAGDRIVEMARFTFERLSDHRIAKSLLDTHVTGCDPTPTFATGGALASYVTGPDASRFAGIAEALAVQLPERYGVELIDVVADRFARWDLLHAFRLSLLWRRQDTFSERTLALIHEFADAMGDDAELAILLTIATEPDNRFNADYLDRWLNPLSMPERDVQWSTRATLLMEDSEEGGGAVGNLIEWAIAAGLESIDPARARLATMTLAWLTSLSHRWVRDMATKALAMLLVDRRALAAQLIDHFADCGDAYVIDRVLAAAYGAATRRAGTEGLADLARAAFAAVFARDPLPSHALVRDHARGLIELATSRGALPPDIALDRARPPYPRGAPLENVSDEMLYAYLEDYGDQRFRDRICGSALEDGDFARYEIDPLAGDFLLLPREELGKSLREIYDAWHRGAIASDPARAAVLDRAIEIARRIHLMPNEFAVVIRDRDDDAPVDERRAAETELAETLRELERLLTEAEIHEFRIRAACYLRGPMWDQRASASHPTYAGKRSRRWVAWRAHELGWTSERFAAFDRHVASHGRMEHRVERIGKKYQWIAYHELAGRLSDSALVDGGYQSAPEIYHGPWQVGAREMDPTILVTRTKQRDGNRDGPTWWSPHFSRWRNDPPQARVAWMEDESRDIPDAVHQIDVAQPDGRRWYVLDISVAQYQWVMVEGERTIHRMAWHKLKSVLVKREKADQLERLLKRSPNDRDHFREIDMPYQGYIGEYPWHPVFANINANWQLGKRGGVSVQATVADWLIERAGHNYSVEDSFNVTVPAPVLMRGLNLRLAEGRSLSYTSGDGRVSFVDPSADAEGPSAALIDRDALRAFLNAEGLQIVWIFTGEKSAHGGRPHGSNAWGGRLGYWGIYRLQGDVVEGALSFERQDARPEQLAELLAFP